MDKQKAKQQMQNGAKAAVERAVAKLRGRWSNGANRHCLDHSYQALAISVGLPVDQKTIDELKAWVTAQKLPEPFRPKPKGNGV
jgi:hypothetical protein